MIRLFCFMAIEFFMADFLLLGVQFPVHFGAAGQWFLYDPIVWMVVSLCERMPIGFSARNGHVTPRNVTESTNLPYRYCRTRPAFRGWGHLPESRVSGDGRVPPVCPGNTGNLMRRTCRFLPRRRSAKNGDRLYLSPFVYA